MTACVLLIGLLVSIAVVVHQSRRSVEREIGSVLTFAASTIDSAVADGVGERALLDLARHLDAARHICILPGHPPAALACPTGLRRDVPRWFSRWVMPQQKIMFRSLTTDDADGAAITLVADPGDEIAEAWQDARSLLAALVITTMLVLMLSVMLVRRGLRPLNALSASIEQMRCGDFGRPCVTPVARDLAQIAFSVEALRQQLERSRADNHHLLKRCLETQEAERVSIARDLHDDLGQLLTATDVDIAVARTAVHGLPATDDALKAASDNIRSAQISLRRLLQGLRPGGLEHIGLAAALRQLVNDWQQRLPNVRFVADIDDTITVVDTTHALHLYRIAQEALTNIARHADANEVLVGLGFIGGHLRLAIADNGRGLPQSRRHRGLGVAGMFERARALGTELKLTSQPRCGCRVELALAR